jgi:glycosyltransferase involved in cell wall biosynthesis
VRIGIDTRLMYYQRAGIASYVVGLLQGIATVGSSHEFVVFPSRRDKHASHLPSRFIRHQLWTPPHHRFERLALAVELVPVRLDILHSPDFIPPMRVLSSRRSVITVHDLAFLKYPEVLTPESKRYYGSIGPAVEQADAVIAVSENTKRDLMALLDTPEEKIHVIAEAADLVYRPASDLPRVKRTLERFGVRGPYFLFVGTIEPKKNLKTLFEAYANFRKLVPGALALPDLVVVGRKGWLYADILKVVDQLDLKSHVHFLGRVDQDDLVSLYNGALALTYPSLYEGFGLPALEAMQSGTPVVTSNISSLPEVVGEAAITVDPRDAEAMTQAMSRIWSSPELRADLRRRGLARAAQFTREEMARATLEVYDRLAR